MKQSLLTFFLIILIFPNISMAVTILSEHYSVSGTGFSGSYSKESNTPPLTDSNSGASSTADYFQVHAWADIYIGPPEDQYCTAWATSSYEIVPTSNWLRIWVKNPNSWGQDGEGGFNLFDQTDSMLIASYRWSDWDAEQERVRFSPVETDHQYEFSLWVIADSMSPWAVWDSEIELIGEISSVPEPSVFLLLALGSAILRKRKAKI